MALLKIAQLGNPVLRQKSEPVSPEEIGTPEFQNFLDDMAETMRDAPGVGLAAPQVHRLQRIFLVEVSPDNPRYPGNPEVGLTVVINPEILGTSREVEYGWESCLSVQELKGMVPRYSALTLRYTDGQGEVSEVEAGGFLARVIQHELDHLDGIVFLDRMEDLSTLTHSKEFGDFWLEYEG